VRYRRTPQRLAELQALADGDLGALLAVTPQGLDLRRLAAAMGQALDGPQQAEALATALRHTDAHGDWAIGPVQAGQGGQAVLAALAAFHEREPDELGPAVQRLRRLALPRWPEPLWQALLRRLQEQGAVKVQGAFVHLPEHGVRLSATEQRIAQKVAPLLASAGFEGAWARDLARDTGESEALVRVTLSRLARRGELHQVVKDLFYPQSTIATLAGIARTVANDHGRAVTAAAFRDATRLGRKRAIQILEYFDRIGLLRRVGDEHRLRTDAEWFTEERATTS
jgi:selenocysteine-specific elongation factor